jgi:DNA-binding MarR family transcriptional regulator
MTTSPNDQHELIILEKIEQDPDSTQASLAAQIGVAVGTINWHIKRMITKGYVKVKRAQRKKLRYIITPEGIALRARLTVDYIQNSFHLYRLVRERMISVLDRLKQAGHNRISLQGEGDVAEICRLTCLEHGFSLVEDASVPNLHVLGLKIFIAGWDEDPIESGISESRR